MREQLIDDVAAALRARGSAALPARSGPVAPTRLVTIDGYSGSGKSTLAVRLATVLAAPVLTLDDLYPGWDGLAAAVPLAVEWIAAPLAAGRPARWRCWDWARGAWGSAREQAPTPLVLLEGCGAGARALAPFTDTLIWVDAPAVERAQRLRARADWSGYAPFRDRWAAQETDLEAAERTRERADLMVDNGDRPLRSGPPT